MKHDALFDAGWQCQTTIDEPRLSELAENYRALGYAVLVVHETPSGSGCYECFKAAGEAGRSVGTIYTRRQPDAQSLDEALF